MSATVWWWLGAAFFALFIVVGIGVPIVSWWRHGPPEDDDWTNNAW